VFQITAFKEYAFAIVWRYALHTIGMVNAKLTTIGGYPIHIQVHDHGVLAAAVVFKLIDVFFLKSARHVQRVVKLVTRDAGIAGAVKVAHKAVH
jgi:hypothetical protein